MKMSNRGWMVVVAAVLASAGIARAQDYRITWHSIDAGGSMFTTGANYRLGSTIGQHDAGPLLSAGGKAVSGGFWVAAASFPSPPCPADFNRNGQVSVQDIFDFLAAYFGGEITADFNGNGQVSVQDIFDYLAAYFAGCS